MIARALLGLAALSGASLAQAEVVHVEISEQREWVAGHDFTAGSYEMLAGIVYYEIDPKSASAKDVADIEFAPVNAKGKVEYSGSFLLLRPTDPTKANGTTIVEVPNRGGPQTNGIFYNAFPMALANNKISDVSYNGIFDRGYTMAWVGWQADLKPDQFGLKAPRANVSGMVRATAFVGGDGAASDSGAANYGDACAADASDASAELRILKSYDDPGTLIPRDQWSFAKRDKDGSVKPDPCAFLLNKAVDGRAMVSILYKAQPPSLIGLGQAAVRDFVIHLKHSDVASPLNARGGDAKQVIGFGYSQSARFLRDFVYRGFNADARGRKVFDGVMDVASGAGRGSFNHRYASPGQAGNSVGSALRAVDLYPFADLPTADIDGKGKVGLLDRATKAKVEPKIFHVLSSSEYWARAGSLIQATPDGKSALPEAANARTYFLAGAPHAPALSSTMFLASNNPVPLPYNDSRDMGLVLPALLEAMRLWNAEGKEPPASRSPAIGTELVEPAKLVFPKIPKIWIPPAPPPVWQLDNGPDYVKKHIITEPPKIGPRYNLLVPQVNADGNEIGGWHGLMSSVPLGTYTAWNVDENKADPFGMLSGLQGAFIPFAATKSEREQWGDPRPSLAERYGGKGGYLKAIAAAIEKQVEAGFMLPSDTERAMEAAIIAWDRAATARTLWMQPKPQ